MGRVALFCSWPKPHGTAAWRSEPLRFELRELQRYVELVEPVGAVWLAGENCQPTPEEAALALGDMEMGEEALATREGAGGQVECLSEPCRLWSFKKLGRKRQPILRSL